MVILSGLSGRRYPIHVARGTARVPEVECGRNTIPRFALGFGKELKSCGCSSGCKGMNRVYRFDTVAMNMI